MERALKREEWKRISRNKLVVECLNEIEKEEAAEKRNKGRRKREGSD